MEPKYFPKFESFKYKILLEVMLVHFIFSMRKLLFTMNESFRVKYYH